MMDAPYVVPYTAGSLLYGNDVVTGLAAEITRPETRIALGRRFGDVGATALTQVQQQLAGKAAGFLQVDLVTVVMAGWAKQRQLTAAAQRTAQALPGDPQEQEWVGLAGHDIVLTQRPTVDVVVNGTTILTLAFELTMTITVEALDALVRRGRLVGLGGGQCRVKIAFSLAGTDLGHREHVLNLGLVLPLGQGIRLGLRHAWEATAG
jgi:hypothetical protein